MDNRKKSRRDKTFKRLTALSLAVMFALSFAGCGNVAKSSSQSQDKNAKETTEVKATEAPKYSNVAINSAKKAIQCMQDYVDGKITASEAEDRLEKLENDLGDYLLKNENLPTTENDRWISGEIDLSKYSAGMDDVVSVTEHMDKLKSMIK